MKDNSITTNNRGKAHLFLKTEILSQAISQKVAKEATDNMKARTIFTKEIISMIKNMAMESNKYF